MYKIKRDKNLDKSKKINKFIMDSNMVIDADPENLLIKHWITTESVDRDSEIMVADGRVQRGVVAGLWLHGKDSHGRLPIYKVVEFIRGQKDGVPGWAQLSKFYKPGFEELKNDSKALYSLLVYDMILQGLITGSSVGFIPMEVSEKIVDDKHVLSFDRWEHLETSFVDVPANPEALVMYLTEAVSAGKATEADIVKLFGKECKNCGHCSSEEKKEKSVDEESTVELKEHCENGIVIKDDSDIINKGHETVQKPESDVFVETLKELEQSITNTW